MEGFDAGDKTVPGPLVEVAGEVRERLIRSLAAVICGLTPEMLAASLETGEFPGEVDDMLERPLERAELGAHLDLILGVLQAPAGASS